jgi:hypothetical protein
MRWFLSNEKYGFLLKKNFYQKYHCKDAGFVMEAKTNSLGPRDHEHDLSKKDMTRILLLGDSFVFGHGINMEDHFCTKFKGPFNQSEERYFVIKRNYP